MVKGEVSKVDRASDLKTARRQTSRPDKKYIIPKECGCVEKRVCILSTESWPEARWEEVAGENYGSSALLCPKLSPKP